MVDATKKRVFRQFSYRGKNLEELDSMPASEFAKIVPSNLRRHLLRGINKYEFEILKKCVEYRKELEAGKKPSPIKTNERTQPIMPQMVGVSLAVHCGNGYVILEVKPEMLGKRVKDFIPTRPVCKHGNPGVGATAGSRFVPLK